jgi:transcriptional regulator with XRE-family HTH domain
MPAIEPFYKKVGGRISEIRRQRGMTQEKLGNLLQPAATRASIANAESGKQRILAHTLVQIADALTVNLSELLDISTVRSIPKIAAVASELEAKLDLTSAQLEKLRHELGLLEPNK